jgi:hypothetical protein
MANTASVKTLIRSAVRPGGVAGFPSASVMPSPIDRPRSQATITGRVLARPAGRMLAILARGSSSCAGGGNREQHRPRRRRPRLHKLPP